ncbi:MAG: YbjQ family protein [Candidatus Hodarchaeales archaeon]|jgi:uncharacterized protein YbjQ (UPF0145 family)
MYQQQPQGMVYISTSNEIPGFEIIEYLGIVFGITVRSRGAGGQCFAGCQTCIGGEISALAESSIEARNDAIMRLMQEAQSRGANGIITVRFDSNRAGRSGELMDIVAYGTAVKVIKKG